MKHRENAMAIAQTATRGTAQPKIQPGTDLVLREEVEPGIVRLTLYRPDARNALSIDLLAAL